MKNKPVLDVCCGGRMFWFDKHDTRTVYMDKRKEEYLLCDGRTFKIAPDIVGDFRKIPFQDNTFSLVIFDPPHLHKAGETSWLAKKYGVLGKNWEEDLKQGFSECFRVLTPLGILVFKWNEEQIPTKQVLALTPQKPLILHKRQKTKFIIFMKKEEDE